MSFNNNTPLGQVKFQNAFTYYEIMYNLYKKLLQQSNACRVADFKSVHAYYNIVKELYEYIEPFLRRNNREFRFQRSIYRFYLYIRKKHPKMNKKDVLKLLRISEKELKQIIQIFKEKNKLPSIIDYIENVEKQIKECGVYSQNRGAPQELSKRTTKIKYYLDIAKRTMATEMKNNKLTVPIGDFNASEAVRYGYQ